MAKSTAMKLKAAADLTPAITAAVTTALAAGLASSDVALILDQGRKQGRS